MPPGVSFASFRPLKSDHTPLQFSRKSSSPTAGYWQGFDETPELPSRPPAAAPNEGDGKKVYRCSLSIAKNGKRLKKETGSSLHIAPEFSIIAATLC